jgi:hypothetical protein
LKEELKYLYIKMISTLCFLNRELLHCTENALLRKHDGSLKTIFLSWIPTGNNIPKKFSNLQGLLKVICGHFFQFFNSVNEEGEDISAWM